MIFGHAEDEAPHWDILFLGYLYVALARLLVRVGVVNYHMLPLLESTPCYHMFLCAVQFYILHLCSFMLSLM